MSARLEEVSRVYGLPLDPKREVWQLSVGERQRIEIVRALMQNPKFLILDEPTAVLTPQEADQLFIVLDRLKAEGRAILYISHKLEEVKRLCDTATILRGGKKVSTCNPQGGDRGLARAHDGRRRDQGSEGRRQPANHGAAAGRQRSQPRAGRSPRRAACSTSPSSSRVAKSWASPASPATARTNLFAALSGERLAQDPGTVVIDGHAAGHLSITAAAQARRGLRSRGTARPRHRAAHEAVRERAADRPCRQRHGPARLRQHRRDAEDRRPRHRDLRRAQGQARSGSRQPLRRQSAEIHRRPRNPAQPGGAGGEPADLGRRCRRRRRDPPGPARSRRRAAPRCWSPARISTNSPKSPTASP